MAALGPVAPAGADENSQGRGTGAALPLITPGLSDISPLASTNLTTWICGSVLIKATGANPHAVFAGHLAARELVEAAAEPPPQRDSKRDWRRVKPESKWRPRYRYLFATSFAAARAVMPGHAKRDVRLRSGCTARFG